MPTDYPRIRRNISKMIEAGAGREQIDQYLQGEGTHQGAVRAYADFESAANSIRENYPDYAERMPHTLEPYTTSDQFAHGMMFGLSDEIASFTQAAQHPTQFMDAFTDFQRLNEARLALGREESGVGGTVAEIAGSVLPGAAMFPAKAIQSLSMGPRIAASAGVGGLLGGAYGAADTPGGLEERAQGAVVPAAAGATLGAVAPVIGEKVAGVLGRRAQNQATNAAIRNTPSSAELRSNAAGLFNQMRHSGTGVRAGTLYGFGQRLSNRLYELGADPGITPKSARVFQRISQDVASAFSDPTNPRPIRLSTVHVWRRMAGNAAMSPDASERKMGAEIIGAIDDLVDNLAPGDMVIDPALFSGTTMPQNQAFRSAIDTYRRAAKMGTLEAAIESAANYQSGVESGLRNQFARILKSSALRRGFTKPEIAAMERVSKGSVFNNLLRLFGTMGLPIDQQRAFLGSLLGGGATYGLTGGNLPAAALAVGLGTGAKLGSRKLTEAAANRAVRVVGTPDIPILPPVNPDIFTRIAGGMAPAPGIGTQ